MMGFKVKGGKGNLRGLADAARDARDYARSVTLYADYLRRSPDDVAIHVRCGLILEESGNLSRFEME